MPRKALFSKEEIIEKAFQLVREKGQEALTARELGTCLGTSSRPIFTLFNSMDEVRNEIREKAREYFNEYMSDALNYTPAFKEYGKRIVLFAHTEKHLFQLIFLAPEAKSNGVDQVAMTCLDAMTRDYQISQEDSMLLLGQCWTFACGLATLIMTGALDYDEAMVNEALGRQFACTLYFIKTGKHFTNITPHPRSSEEESITLKSEFPYNNINQ